MNSKKILLQVLSATLICFLSSCKQIPTMEEKYHLSTGKWRELLADDLSNCGYKPGSWIMENDVLTPAVGDDLLCTKERFGDFILDLEFKLAPQANSGIFIRMDKINDLATALEVQVLDDSWDETKKYPQNVKCGAICGHLAPTRSMVKEPGQWNHCIITCKANKVYVVLNGEQIIDMNLDLWTDAKKNPDGTDVPPWLNKIACRDMPREGHIAFQGRHGNHPVWYRNIKIKSWDQ